jgi:hypothetical protein
LTEAGNEANAALKLEPTNSLATDLMQKIQARTGKAK